MRFLKISALLTCAAFPAVLPYAAFPAALLYAAFPAAAAEMTLLRLTPDEYQRTIQDVFGPTIHVEPNAVETGFRDQGLLAVGARKLTLTSAGLERDETLAQDIAGQVMMDPKRAATLIHCKPKADDAPDKDCASQFITRVGLLLFRRPLTAAETQSFVDTAKSGAETLHSFNAGMAGALSRMLVSPSFLFRIERSAPDAVAPDRLDLDAWSRASRLSFFLWDSPPDAELLAAAQSGKIMTPQGLNQQVERLLNSPRAEDGLRAFFADMLGFDAFATLTKDTNIFPKFTKNVEDDAREQTLRTIASLMLKKNGDYRDLFTTRDTFLTPSLAAVYGVPLPRSQELGGAVPWVPYQFPEGDAHVGLLTQVSFLALNSHPGVTSPTLRGKAMRENLMCQKVPPPPGNVDFSLVSDTTNPNYKTARQRLTAHRKEAMCAGCHKIMDPIGLALENFDSSGVARTSENGAPIDVTGDLNGKPFNGVAQLAAILHDDPGTTACMINRAFSYGAARGPTTEEAAWLATVQTDLRAHGVKWRELMRRLTENPAFYNVIPAAEAQRADAQP